MIQEQCVPIADCTVDMSEKSKMTMAVRDAMELLNGKWKILIIGTLSFSGKKRFMELTREVDGIAPKVLSKELQELEMNKVISRTICNTRPVTVEYEITPYGKTLDGIIVEVMKWGMQHRHVMMNS